MNNNNVYVDEKGVFYVVNNNDFFAEEEMQCLKDEYNFHFLFGNDISNSMEDIKVEVAYLSLEKQLELLSKLEEKWCLAQEYRFDIDEAKEEYLEIYEEFDKEDFDIWLKEEVLSEYFDSIDTLDVDLVLDYLGQNKKGFLSFKVYGYFQGEVVRAWCDNEKAMQYCSNSSKIEEHLANIFFDSWVDISTANEKGVEEEIIETIPSYYIDNSGSVNEYLNEYMQKEYNARLANYEVIYS